MTQLLMTLRLITSSWEVNKIVPDDEKYLIKVLRQEKYYGATLMLTKLSVELTQAERCDDGRNLYIPWVTNGYNGKLNVEGGPLRARCEKIAKCARNWKPFIVKRYICLGYVIAN